MPINWSDAYYDNKSTNWKKHAPACNCWRCVEGRNKTRSDKKASNIQYARSNTINETQVNPPYKHKNTPKYKPTWITALLLIFALNMTGLGLSIYIGLFEPLWILFLFSIIFTIENRTHYILIRHKTFGTLYRIFLNLTLLFAISITIGSGIKLFSKEFVYPLTGSLIFIGELIFFIWLWRIINKNSWRWPSMKLTIVSLLAITIIFSYAGVQPLAQYKDSLITKWNIYWESQKR